MKGMSLGRLRTFILLAAFLAILACRRVEAYSLLTHEQLIDLTWHASIVPLLLSRYPNLTPEELEQARAYAYGGCVIQDIGYYPFGDLFYSDLTHYVRSGDFVVNLFRDAQNADELAFAVGALSHYIGDSNGHPLATNVAVPVEFPDLEAKYGKEVNFAEGKHQHVQTEFAFDINEIAHHRMAPVHYVRHIGLKVPVRLLTVAFYQTYGISEDFSMKRRRRFNVGAYRFAVHRFIPRIAYAITLLKRRHEPADPDTPEAIALRQEVATLAAEEHWDEYRRKAGIGTWTLAGLLFILPKVGPLSLVAVKGPTEETENEYVHSVTASVNLLRQTLARFTPPAPHSASGGAPADEPSKTPVLHSLPADRTAGPAEQHRARDPRHPLPNRDLDTGYVIKPGGYSLTDSTYAQLLHRLTHQNQPIPPGIQEDIEAYYANPEAPISTKKDPAKWAEVQKDLETLKTMPLSPEPPLFPTYGDDESAQ